MCSVTVVQKSKSDNDNDCFEICPSTLIEINLYAIILTESLKKHILSTLYSSTKIFSMIANAIPNKSTVNLN